MLCLFVFMLKTQQNISRGLTIKVFINGEFGHQTVFQKVRGKLLQLGLPVLDNLHTAWITHFHIYKNEEEKKNRT